jgi:hypothetical protein
MPIIQQGRFTSTGLRRTLALRNGVDWIKVINETNLIQAAADLPYEYYFQLGMASGRGSVWTKLGAVANDPVTVAQIAAGSGFVLVDANDAQTISPVAVTSVSNATVPIVTVASTAGLSTGDVIRLIPSDGQPNISGMNFTITITGATTFTIAGAGLATAPGAAGTNASLYSSVTFNPLFNPSERIILNAVNAGGFIVFTVNQATGWARGQKIRVQIPSAFYGSIQLDNLVGTVTAVDDTSTVLSVTTDIPSAGLTAFTFPTAAIAAANHISRAMLTPFGENTAYDLAQTPPLNTLTSATYNTGIVGVSLLPGASAAAAGPAGFTVGDVIYWIAGSSDAISNL